MENPTSPSKQEVLHQLEKILRSQTFRGCNMLQNFLSFIVQEQTKEEGIVLKQYNIGIHAFGRSVNFDASSDPIVRIQAGRLRIKLALYYKEQGAGEEIVISLPKGGYIPKFDYSNDLKTLQLSANHEGIVLNTSLALFPIKNLSKNQEKHHIVEGFNNELLIELSHYKDLEVIRMKEDSNFISKNAESRFCLEGSIQFVGESMKLSIVVTDNSKSQLVWSYQEKCNIDTCDLIKVQEDAATAIAQQLGGVNGIIFEKLFLNSNWEDTRNPLAYSTFMYYHVFYKDPSEKNAHILLKRLTTILEKEPDFAPGLAVLANLYTNVYLSGLDQTYLDEALSLGKRAVELQANNQVCQMYYAYALLVDNQLEEAGKRFDKALSLNPNAPIYSGTIGFCLCLIMQLDRGFKLVQRSMELDFQYPEWLHVGPFLYYLEKKDYDNVFIEANKMVKPVLFWTSLLKLVACQKLKQHEQASKHLYELKEVNPDFIDRPKEFIRCLVKSEALSTDILETFNAVLNSTDKAFSK